MVEEIKDTFPVSIIYHTCQKISGNQKVESTSMVEEFAKKLFLGQQEGYKKLNCAQAIAEAFREEYGFITDETVKLFKKMGKGKAPNGECGTVYAAKFIFIENNRSDKAKEFEKYFVEFAGTTKCKELIKKKIPFCAYCIGKTAKFINDVR